MACKRYIRQRRASENDIQFWIRLECALLTLNNHIHIIIWFLADFFGEIKKTVILCFEHRIETTIEHRRKKKLLIMLCDRIEYTFTVLFTFHIIKLPWAWARIASPILNGKSFLEFITILYIYIYCMVYEYIVTVIMVLFIIMNRASPLKHQPRGQTHAFMPLAPPKMSWFSVCFVFHAAALPKSIWLVDD